MSETSCSMTTNMINESKCYQWVTEFEIAFIYFFDIEEKWHNGELHNLYSSSVV
jgi:hypothetical protein